jgi:hypothetical protein
MSPKEEDLVFDATFSFPIEFGYFELEIDPPIRRVVFKPKTSRKLRRRNECEDILALSPRREKKIF